MKTTLLAIFAGAAIIIFSTVSFADGEACDSKKRGHGSKDMSAEAMKQYKDHHEWYSKDSAKQEHLTIKKDAAVKI